MLASFDFSLDSLGLLLISLIILAFVAVFSTVVSMLKAGKLMQAEKESLGNAYMGVSVLFALITITLIVFSIVVTYKLFKI